MHAFTLRGRWRYLEHDWEAVPGSYAFERPGKTHTLVVPEDVSAMVTLFHVTGSYVYVDPDGVAHDFMAFFGSIGLPCDRTGLDMTEPGHADVVELARWSMTVPHRGNEPVTVTQVDLKEAIERLERLAAGRGVAA